MKKWGSFFTLLTTKGYRKVILIPLAFCLGFFLYSLCSNFLGGEVDKTTYADGTVRIFAQSDLGLVKLPKMLDELNIPIHDDLKIKKYDVLLDKDEHIEAVNIYCTSNKDANEIIEWYKEKLNVTDRANGDWNGFDMDVSYSENSKLFSISLKKE